MIHPSTFDFLRDLDAHNHKEWFDEHRDRYQAARKDVIAFIDQLIEEIAAFDPAVRGLEAKQCLFRINRDVRFSKNKDPYKTNFGASISRGGRSSVFAGYYLHLQPGDVFAGGGLHMPPSTLLKTIRGHIDLNAPDLRAVVETPAFRETYGELRGDSLKTAPKGYEKDHPAIDLLRLKSYTGIRQYPDEALFQDGFVRKVADDFAVLKPMLDFLNEAIGESEAVGN
jgi:uncharacterized protein (TIGR02453 family)